MENNVVTLETAKKLKAAGFPQLAAASQWAVRVPYGKWYLYSDGTHRTIADWLAAPTAQEIADQLPERIQVYKQDNGEYFAERVKPWSQTQQFGPTMAEALAALWLKLHDTGGDHE